MKKQIFVSYSRKDTEIVSLMCTKLKTISDMQICMDTNEISVGDNFAQAIIQNIKSVDAILLFYSEDSSRSLWVKREIEYAISLGKRIITVVLSSNNENSWLKSNFSDIKYVLCENGNIDSCVRQILELYYKSYPNQDFYAPNRPSVKYCSPCTNRGGLGCLLKFAFIVLITTLVILLVPNIFDVFLPQAYCPPNLTETVLDDTLFDDNIKNDISSCDTLMTVIDDTSIYDTILLNKKKVNLLSKEENMLSSKNSFSSYILYCILLLIALSSSIIFLILWRKKIRPHNNLKLSSNIACRLSIDGEIIKELAPNEVLKINLAKGEYIIDCNNPKHYERFTHNVLSIKEVKVINCDFNIQMNIKTIKCFIAGSTQLERERDGLRAAISIIYNKWQSKNFNILSYTFEDFERRVIEGGPQQIYDHFITNEADWAIFIMDTHIGEITANEFNKALNAFKENKKPKILIFSKYYDVYSSEITELQKLIDSVDQYWISYQDINNLKSSFIEILNWDLIELFQEELVQ